MSKIVLDSVVSGYDLSKINSNFQKIQAELNDKVLYRNAPIGEPNTLEKDIDANGKKILNLGSISIKGYTDLTAMIKEANSAKDQAIAAKDVVIGVEDEFTDIYLGNKSADPLIDNDGNPLIEGCFYFNVALNPKRLRVYNGVGWQDAAASVTNVVNTIDNSLYPSQAEAEAGVNDVKVMTPLRTKQSILVNAATLAQGVKADSALQPSAVGTGPYMLLALDSASKIPAVDGSQLTNLPTDLPPQTGNQGKFLKTDGSVTSWANVLTSGTANNTTSGTAHDFTGIPVGVKRISINFDGVSTNGTSNLFIQIGDSGGIETTGYKASGIYGTSVTGSTSGFTITAFRDSASETYSGSVVLSIIDSSTFKWAESGVLATEASRVHTSAGSKAVSAVLDRLRLTTVNGTDVFDAGSVNILYE